MKNRKFLLYLIIGLCYLCFFVFLALEGCAENGVSPTPDNLSLSIATSGGLRKISNDSLYISSAKIMVRDLELKGGDHEWTWGGDNEEGHGDDTSRTSVLKYGPFVVNLSLNGSVNTIAVNTIKAGTYGVVEFKIHKPTPGETVPDTEFTSGGNSYSVIINGTFNGKQFDFKSGITAKQRVILNPPVTVNDSSVTNVTLTVNPYDWFYVNGKLLDPADSTNADLIDMMIRHSFRKCFKDDDRNGEPDD